MPTIRIFPLLASLFTTLGVVTGAQAQIAFADVSSAARVDRSGESYGASWGDLNGDGYPDIFASNHRQQPSLFLNMGNGTFYETAPQVLTWRNRSRADTHGGSWSDFDNDGDEDLLVSAGTGNLSQLLVNEYGRLVDRTVERGLTTVNLGGRLPVWFDYDGDKLTDFVMTQYGGIAKLYRQSSPGRFTETTSDARLLCKRFHYGQLVDVTGDERLDMLCSDEELFPQKIYNTLPLPWKKVYDNTVPARYLPAVAVVADSIPGDFNNDGRMDLFILGGAQLRPAGVEQGSATHLESQLTGGTKGFKFVTYGNVTFKFDWNKQDERKVQELTRVEIGAGARNPDAWTFTLDPADPRTRGMPPAPTTQAEIPVMQMGYDGLRQQWTVIIQTRLTPTSPNVFSEAYVQVDSTQTISNVTATGLWPTDKPSRPTLLTNYSGGFVDETARAGLDALVHCVSATAEDFDNDMDVDLYLACRTSASNIPNILYENLGDGTFRLVPGAGGAPGPVGIAVASGAGTADTVVSADYNVDGFVDLFVTNGFNLRPLNFGGANSLFRNQGNANRWIEIDLVGTGSDRDAVGARVFATAAGKTQMRIQNGGYHRWAQDMRRSHFGLGAAATVDLRVEWPSGSVQNLPGVAANRLYRITEGGGIVAVTPGAAAPVYQCGAPPLNGAVDAGIFLWQDCPSGEWRLKAVAAGGAITFAGTLTTINGAYTSVKRVALESNDVANWLSNPYQIAFRFNTTGNGDDGINFLPQGNTKTCVKTSAPAGVKIFVGPFRKPLTTPFELSSQAPCYW